MASDLKINIDGVRLNIRVGAIIRHNDDIVLEISTVGANSVIPGGRIKINESSLDAVLRELKEELNYEFDKNKFKQPVTTNSATIPNKIKTFFFFVNILPTSLK